MLHCPSWAYAEHQILLLIVMLLHAMYLLIDACSGVLLLML